MESGYVVSDLHLFTGRSVAEEHMGQLHAAADEADFFVLNGDTVDFRWSVLPTTQQTIDAADEWIRELTGRHPKCRFVLILGNHDNVVSLADHLTALADELDNFDWHSSHVRIGTALFLHGDLVRNGSGKGLSNRPLDRAKYHAGAVLHLCYDLAIALRLHLLYSLIHRPKRFAKRILQALRTEPNGLGDALTDVYFGHTHIPLHDYRVGGLTFHNTGSAVRGLRFSPMTVRVPAENRTGQ